MGSAFPAVPALPPMYFSRWSVDQHRLCSLALHRCSCWLLNNVVGVKQQTYHLNICALPSLAAAAPCCQGAGAASAGGAAGDEPLVVPEDIGRAAAQLLLDEVSRGGVTDGTHQALLLLLTALGPEQINQVCQNQVLPLWLL